MQDVPNLRGGPPAWVGFVLGPLLGAAVVAAAAIATIARMPDGTQFRDITRDVSQIKQDVAVSRAHQEAAEQLANERYEAMKAQLRELLGQRRK